MKLKMLPWIFAGVLTVSGQLPLASEEPEIILPSKEKKLDDSRTLASASPPLSLSRLGLLVNDLAAYWSMDDTAKGGLDWSRKPIGVKASPEVESKEADGRTFLDFSKKGSQVWLEPALSLAPRYTLAAWVQAPAPRNDGIIWHGKGSLLHVRPQELAYWHQGTSGYGLYAKTKTPLSGWIHIAVTCDGAKTQAFLNGNPLDVIPGVISSTLRSIGNHTKVDEKRMAAGIDEHFYFTRNLTADEVRKVMAFSQIKK
jgi:hypothetical protein